MLNFNFNLKSKQKVRTPIVLIIRKEYCKVSISTSISIDPKFWDSKKQRVKPQHSDCLRINQELEKMLAFFVKLYNDYYTSKPNEKLFDLRKILKIKLNVSKNYSFFEIFDFYLDYLKTNKSIGIYKKLNTVKNKLFEFSTQNKIEIDFDSINQTFIDNFIQFLLKEYDNSNNTINKNIDNLKMFMTWSKSRDFHKSTNFTEIQKLKPFENEIIYLNEDELLRLEELDLSSNKHLEMNRDLFLFGCYTGQRFSDYSNFDKSELNNNFWVVNQRKSVGNSVVRIPLIPQAQQILKKYNNELPKISSQKFNKNVKTISKLANIVELKKTLKYQGNKRVEVMLPKYELISSHTARRTFITLSLIKGIQPEAIKKVSGHTSDKEFKKYLKIEDFYIEDQVLKGWVK